MDKEIIKEMRLAIKNDNLERVKQLLNNNKEMLNFVTVFGSWLHDAATYGKYNIAKYLVDCGIDITANYDIGKLKNVDAYEYARQYGRTEIANYLKEKMEK